MSKTNNFGATLKEGNNLDVLRKAREYFDVHENIYIARYYCCTDNAIKHEKWVSKGELRHCEICNKKLYEEREVSDSLGVDEAKQIKQKKHMVFIDNQGKKHHTCYGIQWCFKNVGFKYDKSHKDEDFDGQTDKQLFSPPDFQEFIPVENPNYNGLNKEVFESAKTSYKRIVVPFMNTWTYTSIDKSNVLRFMRDLQTLEQFFNYFDKQSGRKTRQKLYDILGIDYD